LPRRLRSLTYNDAVNFPSTIGLIAVSYLLGSIPFSFLIVKLVAGRDIREFGSGNVGATNVARSFGKLPGLGALILDGAKGYCAILFAQWLTASRLPIPAAGDGNPLHSRAFWVGLAGLAAMVGHMFPAWIGFRGGKGVATAAGVFLAVDPIATAAAALVFLIAALATRFVSIGSMTAAASIPLVLRFVTHAPFWTVILSILISVAVIAKHHTNIARLISGRERQMGSGEKR
jgi:acyl phosphate:glycerol-3-phosphate acyltransferase